MATFKKAPGRTQRNGPPALGPQPDGLKPAQPAGPMGKSVAGHKGRLIKGDLIGGAGASTGSKKRPPQKL